MPRPLAGPLVLGIGTLHVLTGLVLHSRPLADMVGAGVVDTLQPDLSTMLLDREAAYWFEMAGALMLLLGALMTWVERRMALPASFAWGLLAVAAVGILVSPVTGLWTVLAPAAVILSRARRTRAVATVGAR